MTTELTIRRPSSEDATIVADLVTSAEKALAGADEMTAEELRDEWGGMNLDRDAWLIELDGRLADGYVHPDFFGRGLGRRLVRLTEDEAAARGGKSYIRNAVMEQDARARCLLESEGYRLARYYYRMLIELDEEPPPPAWPAGIAPIPFDFERDAESVKAAVDEALAEEWGFVPMELEAWKQYMRKRRPDPELWIVVKEEDDVVAVTMCDWNRFGMGWIGGVAVRPAWRRRGLGLALLREAFRRFHGRGQRVVGLAVDAANPTGATRLYERAGMHVAWAAVFYEKELPGAA